MEDKQQASKEVLPLSITICFTLVWYLVWYHQLTVAVKDEPDIGTRKSEIEEKKGRVFSFLHIPTLVVLSMS